MVTILQPLVPHYRKEFFAKMAEKNNIKIYCYESEEKIQKREFLTNNGIQTNHVKSFLLGRMLFYNPMPFLRKNTKYIVLELNFKHISTWALLVTKFIHRKKIILWGQGIAITRFQIDEKKTLIPLKWFLSLADGVWFYTEKELFMWQQRLPKLKAVSLNNTLSGVEQILKVEFNSSQKEAFKEKYKIKQPIVFIFCARFTPLRRVDLLLDVIRKSDPDKYGFIIIGSGKEKPSFQEYKNVYDFGGVYDFTKKNELFAIADIYFQPAWLGLSIVEAMAYQKPVFSFKRAKDVHQCVEYFYVKNDNNGKLFDNVDDFIAALNNLSLNHIRDMGVNARNFVRNNLTMDKMSGNALKLINDL